jgi:hypothetical protein
MYGLFYAAVLGTVGVFTLQKLEDRSLGRDVLAVALTAGLFFSLSFMSAYDQHKQYNVVAFAFDVLEIAGIWACFSILKIVEPLPHYQWLQCHEPRLWVGYLVLFAILIAQIGWRWAMNLNHTAFRDLKGTLLVLMVLGAAWDAVFGARVGAWHFAITVVFAIAAAMYVREDPYEQAKRAPDWYFTRRLARRAAVACLILLFGVATYRIWRSDSARDAHLATFAEVKACAESKAE